MNHKEDAIKKAEEIIQLHKENNLETDDSINASITSVTLLLKVGVYPGYESLYRRTLNYLVYLKEKTTI